MTSASPQLVGYPGESLAPVEPPVAPRVLVPLAAVPAPAPAPAPEQALGAGDLLTIAEGLATIAPRWAGMQRPRRRVWDLMAASESFEAWVVGWPTGAGIDLHDHGPRPAQWWWRAVSCVRPPRWRTAPESARG